MDPEIIDEFLEVYLSAKERKYPDFIKKLHQWVVPDYKIKGYTVYEIPDEKVVDGLKAINKRYSSYIKVKGYKYKIEVLLEGAEALSLWRK